MTTKTKSPTKAQKRRAAIDARLERLATLTDTAAKSKEVLDYLGTVAKFHKYSFCNQMLIAMQRPDASLVAGYQAWKKKFDRQVQKGEKGIAILAPIIYKAPKPETEDDDETPAHRAETVRGFKVVHVFDVSQTEGEPLPEPPEWKSPEQNEKLHRALVNYAATQDIEIDIQDLEGETQGISEGGKIILAPNAGTKTLIHELAHELLHQKPDSWKVATMNRRTKELQAEATAWVVATHYSLEPEGSPNYIALFEGKPEDIRANAEPIRLAAAAIIDGIEKSL